MEEEIKRRGEAAAAEGVGGGYCPPPFDETRGLHMGGALVDRWARYGRTLIPVVFVSLPSFIHKSPSPLNHCL